MIIRKKKVSISYFLNTSLKPKVYSDGTKRYKPYVQINFDGKNTKFRFNIVTESKTEYLVNEKEFEDIFIKKIDAEMAKLLKQHDEMLKEIVYYEYDKLDSKFKLAGIQNRIWSYFKPLDEMFLFRVGNLFQNWAAEYVVHKDFKEIFLIQHSPEKIPFFDEYRTTFNGKYLWDKNPKEIMPKDISDTIIGLTLFLNFKDDLIEQNIYDLKSFQMFRTADWFVLDLKYQCFEFFMASTGILLYKNDRYGIGYNKVAKELNFNLENRIDYFKKVDNLFNDNFLEIVEG